MFLRYNNAYMKKKTATAQIKKIEARFNEVDRIEPDLDTGLTSEQVALRNEQGLDNRVKEAITKTGWEIFAQNFLSFFNILLYIIAAAMMAVGYFSGLFFLVILFANIAIGLIQDIRAKKTLQKLMILAKQNVLVIRDGKEIEIDADDIVLDDLMVLRLGDQVSADGTILQGEICLNESVLTGESQDITKTIGNQVLAGSYVTSGRAIVLTDRVGKARYAQTLQTRARAFKRPKSELLSSIKALFKVIGIFVIVIAPLMIFTYFLQDVGIRDSVISVSGSLVSMIPSGMYLLTSMTLAVGVVRLGKKNTLVQEMYSIEMLARVDVLCLDKTGTLTDGTMKVEEIYRFPDYEKEDFDLLIASLLSATKDDNLTAAALSDYFKAKDILPANNALPFSSGNKYSAVELSNGRTLFLGAAQIVLNQKQFKEVEEIYNNYTKEGYRVLALVESKSKLTKKSKPTKTKLMAFIILSDNIRKEAIETIKWFIENGVKVKIISGDDPATVGSISSKCGVIGASRPLDASQISDEELRKVASQYSVYGRVSPEQKELIIHQLQSEGQTVAMIGDGVNDILALKAADCSIAMAKGSGAARGASHLIIEDNFDVLPDIVDEGRRAINNLQLTWTLFLGKTLFSIIMSIMFLITAILGPAAQNIVYPFSTQNMYIWEIAAIGVPAFFISLQPNKNKIQGSFMGNVILKALPGAITIVISVVLIYLLHSIEQRQPGTTYVLKEGARAMATLTMSFFGFVILFRICLPFTKYRAILFTVLFSLTVLIVTLSGVLRIDLFNINFRYMNTRNIIQVVVINIVAIILYVVLIKTMNKRKKVF